MSSSRRFQRQTKRHQRSRVEVISQGDRVKMPQQRFTLTAEEGRIQARVMEQDAQYFRDHPGETVYDRPAVPGEVPRAQIGDMSRYRVRVERFSDDHRARSFYEVEPSQLCPERN